MTDPNAPWREALAKHRIYHPAGALCYCGWSPEVWPPTKRSEEDAHLAHVAAMVRQAVHAGATARAELGDEALLAPTEAEARAQVSSGEK
jgi:hypothetical protein